MDPIGKAEPRKRQIVGWRQVARRISENRARQRPAPVPLAKR
jgi:hypothetical protein